MWFIGYHMIGPSFFRSEGAFCQGLPIPLIYKIHFLTERLIDLHLVCFRKVPKEAVLEL